jgi:protein-tyrosine phosphatase
LSVVQFESAIATDRGFRRSAIQRFRLKVSCGAGLIIALAWLGIAVSPRIGRAEKRVRVVVPGRLVRGAWQDPESLQAIIARERIKTIVTLTAINENDSKYPGQARVAAASGVHWLIVPMRGSTATLEQMAQAADLLADPIRQPVFFHCVAGHHRTSLAHAAYLIRHRRFSAEQAWSVVASLPWARPQAPADRSDRALIERFAAVQRSIPPKISKGTDPVP